MANGGSCEQIILDMAVVGTIVALLYQISREASVW